MATLKLTLSKIPFDVMITGEKKTEYRRASKWIESRLYDKHHNLRTYAYVEFTNGYGKDKPRFKVEFKGVTISERVDELYSNGLHVDTHEKTYCIHLGTPVFQVPRTPAAMAAVAALTSKLDEYEP